MSADAQFFAERGFGERIGFGERVALCVVDFQVAFTDPSLPLGGDFAPEIAVTQRLVEAAHASSVPVFFTGVRYDEADASDAGTWGRKMRGTITLVGGTPLVEIDPRLPRAAGDIIIWKKRASAFFATDLLPQLVARGIDTLLVCGVTTSGCVRATVVDGVSYGYRVAVVRDAAGDRSASAHEQSLFDMEQKYCDIVAADEAVSYLAGRPSLLTV